VVGGPTKISGAATIRLNYDEFTGFDKNSELRTSGQNPYLESVTGQDSQCCNHIEVTFCNGCSDYTFMQEALILASNVDKKRKMQEWKERRSDHHTLVQKRYLQFLTRVPV
jgi:hypothetical protein